MREGWLKSPHRGFFNDSGPDVSPIQFFRFAEALEFYPHASYQAGLDASQCATPNIPIAMKRVITAANKVPITKRIQRARFHKSLKPEA